MLGIVTILLGLAFAGLVPWLQRDWRVHKVPAVGLAAAPLLGFLFGLGWTPCIGPTLAAITTLSINEATAGRGALLSAVYALGLGLPFVAAGFAYRRALGAFGVRPPPPGLGDAGRRPDAGRRRRPAGHRLVGPGRHLAPDAPDLRHRGQRLVSDAERRPGELTFTEMLRWGWRQLTSMRTALILLLLLALAAIPGLGHPAVRRRLAEDVAAGRRRTRS